MGIPLHCFFATAFRGQFESPLLSAAGLTGCPLSSTRGRPRAVAALRMNTRLIWQRIRFSQGSGLLEPKGKTIFGRQMLYWRRIGLLVTVCLQIVTQQNLSLHAHFSSAVAGVGEESAALTLEQAITRAESFLETDPRKTIEESERARSLARNLKDERSELRILILLGRASDFASEYANAVAYYHEGIALAQRLNALPDLIVLYHRMGIVYAISGDTEEGLALCLKALDLAESTDDALGRSQALGQTGLVYILRKEYTQALNFMARALQAKRDLGLEKEVAGALNNLGVIYRNLGQPTQALNNFQEALAIQTELGEAKSIATSHSYIGKAYADLGEYDRALESQQTALKLRESVGDLRGQSSTLRDIATIYRAIGNYAAALEYTDRNIAIRESILNEESKKRIDELRARFEVRQKEQENEYLRARSRLERIGLVLVFTLVLSAVMLLYLRARKRAKANARALATQRIRNAILRMTGPSGWPLIVREFQHNLSDVLPFDSCCLVHTVSERATAFHLRNGEATVTHLHDISPQLKQTLLKKEPLLLNDTEGLGGWRPCADPKTTSLLAAPYSNGLVLVGRTARPRLGQKERATLLEMASLMSDAARRLEDLQTLEYQERQLHLARQTEALGDLTAGLTHHFNNLLLTILGNIELAEPHVGPEVAPHLEEIRKAGQKASAMLDQLETAVSNAHTSEPKEVLDLGMSVSRVITSDSRLQTPNVPILRKIKSQRTIKGNSGQIEQLFANLIVNAKEAAAAGRSKNPSVLVTVDGAEPADLKVYGVPSPPEGSFCCVEITDNGSGILPSESERVFDPFFTTRGPRHAGLGLPTARSIAAQHGGLLTISSQAGKGTTVRVFLPEYLPLLQDQSSPDNAEVGV